MRLDQREVERWGRRIGAETEAPIVIALQGPLGAGKSVLARAIGQGAGVREAMPSPTFNLLFRYAAGRGVSVVHLDLYRLSDPEEVWELGWAELGSGADIVLIEWPERAEGLLPENRWDVRLTVPEGEPLLRDVEVSRVGAPPDLPGFPVSVSTPSD